MLKFVTSISNDEDMKAIILEEFNSVSLLKQVQKPVAKEGQVLIKIKASGINPLDLKIRAGQAAHAQVSVPAILGIDMAGVIEAIGEGVTNFAQGDEVYGMVGGIADSQGTFAEYIVADANHIAHKPLNISFRDAAALPLNTITAWEALVDRAQVTSDKTVLIHGGAGGVGHLAIQIANYFGAVVYATGNGQQAELIKSYGAIPIDFTKETVQDYVKKHTNGLGFDIIIDTVGGKVLDDSFVAAKRYTGHVVSILGWGNHSLAPLSFRGASYSGVFTLYPLISGQGKAHHGEILKRVAQIAASGKLIPLVDKNSYTLENMEVAYEAVEQRKSNGKVIIEID